MNAQLNDPAEGYVLELGYRHAYHAELSPGLLRFSCLALGIAPPAEGRPLRYLELAFGQGLSLSIHAAADPGEYAGFDINPAHVANALALSAASGSGARILGDSFEEFLAREGAEDFDLIAMHGTWSWISAANRHRVVEIVRRRLAPGGHFYLSYNTWPGWALEMPLRQLLHQHAERASPGAPLGDRIDAALAFAQSMKASGARFFESNPQAGDALTAIAKRDRHYVAHEYFNRDWHPMPFAEVRDTLAAAGLEFAGPVHDDRGVSGDLQALIGPIENPVLRQTMLDYAANRTFRRDLFTKGARRLETNERERLLRSTPVVLLQQPDHVPLDAKSATGACADAAARVVRALADARYSPLTLDAVSRHAACDGLAFDSVVEAARALVEVGSLHPAARTGELAASACKSLNVRLLQTAAREDEAAALASPVTGAGVFVARVELLFLQAIAQGLREPGEWAAHASRSPGIEPLRVARDADAFARIRLPVLQALGVA